MTKYRINQGISKITLANSRAPNDALRQACYAAVSAAKNGLTLTDNQGNYENSAAECWEALTQNDKRRTVLAFISTFDKEAHRIPTAIQWAAP